MHLPLAADSLENAGKYLKAYLLGNCINAYGRYVLE